ncbi:MAG: hypothetical protein EOP84_29520 [Verrucomicrobiaceae bacterium]|nr:MAG: hypothetical protein EOP84_29520 [Verrucomicrobiaceae bacterium]
MNDEEWDDDGDDPFEMLNFFGFGVCDQEEDDDEEFGEEWDDDVHWACMYLAASAWGNWGLFADGLAWDGSRDPDYEPTGAEYSLFDHVRLVLQTRSRERLETQQP